MREAQFQLIVDETKSGKFFRNVLPVSYGLAGACLLCALVPTLRFLLLVLGSLGLLLFGAIAVMEFSNVKLYELAGAIKLAEDGISLNGQFIQVADLQRIGVRFNAPRGQGIGRNGVAEQGNRISIRTKAEEELVAVVLMEARAQRHNLAAVLREWKNRGVAVATDGIDLSP